MSCYKKKPEMIIQSIQKIYDRENGYFYKWFHNRFPLNNEFRYLLNVIRILFTDIWLHQYTYCVKHCSSIEHLQKRGHEAALEYILAGNLTCNETTDEHVF